MARPTFLVVEPEPGFALSSRKLLLETAKFNVLTSHSWQEAEELLERFQRVNAIIVTSEVDEGIPCDNFVRKAKKQASERPLIVLSPGSHQHCDSADYHLCSHEPQVLVDLLRKLFGDPRPDSGF